MPDYRRHVVPPPFVPFFRTTIDDLESLDRDRDPSGKKHPAATQDASRESHRSPDRSCRVPHVDLSSRRRWRWSTYRTHVRTHARRPRTRGLFTSAGYRSSLTPNRSETARRVSTLRCSASTSAVLAKLPSPLLHLIVHLSAVSLAVSITPIRTSVIAPLVNHAFR